MSQFFYVSKDGKSIESALSLKLKAKDLSLLSVAEYLPNGLPVLDVAKPDNKKKYLSNLKEIRNKFVAIRDIDKNHAIQEVKLSVRMAKINLKYDSKNNYYKEQLKKSEQYLNNLLNDEGSKRN